MNIALYIEPIASPSSNNEKVSQQAYQPPVQPSPHIPPSTDKTDESRPSKEQKNVELQRMVQQLYMAQAQVRLY